MKLSQVLKSAAAVVGVLALGYASTANASTAQASLSVNATIQSSCIIAAAPLNFGPYNSTQLDGSTQLTVTCTNTTPYTVSLNQGTNGTSVTARKMKDAGTDLLNYSLFSDTGRTVNWGNTGASDEVSGTGNGNAQTLNVYGRIPGGQALIIGTYSDTVTATVTY